MVVIRRRRTCKQSTTSTAVPVTLRVRRAPQR
jgi:hypothetical protein